MRIQDTTKSVIGKITNSYNHDYQIGRPFPEGFSHDLSLITVPESTLSLRSPMICNPLTQNVGRWADLAATLATGIDILCIRHNSTGVWRHLLGRAMKEKTQMAIVAGMRHYWKQEGFKPTKAVLANFSALRHCKTFSGSPVFTGSPGDESNEVLVFQNFQKPVFAWSINRLHGLYYGLVAWYKGGFLLPEEILESEIVVELTPATHLPRPGCKTEAAELAPLSGGRTAAANKFTRKNTTEILTREKATIAFVSVVERLETEQGGF